MSSDNTRKSDGRSMVRIAVVVLCCILLTGAGLSLYRQWSGSRHAVRTFTAPAGRARPAIPAPTTTHPLLGGNPAVSAAPPAPAPRGPRKILKPRVIPQVPRIAMIDFATDDNLYASRQGCADLTAALQAAIVDVPGITWVERGALDAAAQELRLSNFASVGGAEALRLARWVNADLLVTGRFETRPQHRRVLRIEVLDLYRADVLANREFDVDGDARDPVSVSESDAERAMTELRSAIAEARDRLGDTARAVTIAPLFFRNVSPTPRIDYIEPLVLDQLSTAAGADPRLRLLRFPRQRQSFAELEMAVLGLTEAEPESWQQVADLYVWGSYHEVGDENVPFDQLKVEFTVDVWDGQSEIESISRTAMIAELDAAVARIAAAICQRAASRRGDGPSFDLRDDVSSKLVERAAEVERSIQQYGAGKKDFAATRWAQSLHAHRVRLMETASFFSPLSEPIRRGLLLARWGPGAYGQLDHARRLLRISDYERYLMTFEAAFDPAGGGRSGEFIQRWAYDMSGLLAELGKVRDPIFVSRDRTFPIGVPDEALREWESDLADRAEAMARRMARFYGTKAETLTMRHPETGPLLQISKSFADPHTAARAIDTVWPLYYPMYVHLARQEGAEWQKQQLHERLSQVYTAIGRPERLLEMLEFDDGKGAATPRPAAREDETDYIARQLKLLSERAALAKNQPLEAQMFFDPAAPVAPPGRDRVAPMDLKGIAELDPGICPLRFYLRGYGANLHGPSAELHPHVNRPAITAMALADGLIWIAATGQIHSHTEPGNIHIYAFDPAGDGFVRLTERLEIKSPVNAILAGNGAVFLAMESESVIRIDPASFQATRFDGRDGVITPRMYTIARTWGGAVGDGRVVFGGEAPKLNVYEPSTNRWSDMALSGGGRRQAVRRLVGWKQWLLVPDEMLIIDTASGEAHSLAKVDAIAAALKGTDGIDAAGAGRDGFWMVAGGSLLRYDPESESAGRWPCPLEGVSQLAVDGGLLWLAGSSQADADEPERRPSRFSPVVAGREPPPKHSSFLALWHAAGQGWVGACRFEGRATTLAVDPQSVWIGREGEVEPLLQVDKRGFTAKLAATDSAPPPARPQAPQPLATTPLMRAAYWGDRESVQELMSDREQLNTETELGWTALMAVIAAGHDDIARLLLDGGARVNTVVENYRLEHTPLGLAALLGRVELIGPLIDRGAVVNADALGGTALDHAVRAGHHQIAKLLIAKGAEVDKRGPFNEAPLHVAIARRDKQMLRLLLDAGAEANAEARRPMQPGCAPLVMALESGQTDLVPLLLDMGADPAPGLLAALKSGDMALVKVLLERGASPDVEERGRTALMYAAATGDLELARLLLDRGARADKVFVQEILQGDDQRKRHYRYTALAFAARGGIWK